MNAADELPRTACRDGVQFAKRFKTIKEAWEACKRPEWLFWYLNWKHTLTPSQAIAIAIACAERALPVFERWCPKCKKSIKYIKAVRVFFKNPTEKNRRAALECDVNVEHPTACLAGSALTYALVKGGRYFSTYNCMHHACKAIAYDTALAAKETFFGIGPFYVTCFYADAKDNEERAQCAIIRKVANLKF